MHFDMKDLWEITLYINSTGGEVISELEVYDYIKIMKLPVYSAVDAAGMRAIIFLAIDKREILPCREYLLTTCFKTILLNISCKRPHEIQRGFDSLNLALLF